MKEATMSLIDEYKGKMERMERELERKNLEL